MGLLSILGLGKKEEKEHIEITQPNEIDKFLNDYTVSHDRLMRQQENYESSGAAFGLTREQLKGLDYVMGESGKHACYSTQNRLAYSKQS